MTLDFVIADRFGITSSRHGDLVVRGEIDAATVDAFDAALVAWLPEGSPGGRLDLRSVTFISAAGVRVLAERLQPHRDEVRLLTSEAIRHVLEICEIDLHQIAAHTDTAA